MSVRDKIRRKALETAAREKAAALIDSNSITKYSDVEKIEYDPSFFNGNNWISCNAKANDTIGAIDAQGAALWLAKDGDIWLRTSPTEKPVKVTAGKAKLVMGNLIGKKIRIITGGKEDDPVEISELDLLLIVKDVFDPFKREEFFRGGNAYYRNIFKPTRYMTIKHKPLSEPHAILSLIRHLSGEHYEWVLNWIAQFFQTLKKSQVSLVLRGEQGAGKGIFFSEVIAPLFGEEATIQVNDKALDQNFLGGIVEGRLFFNLDEISHNIAGNKKIKNFLKALVTNRSIVTEKKFENTEEETPLHGQVLITSNEPYIIEVEPKDRRYTVLMTGCKLSKVNYLGYGSYDALSNAIKKDVGLFANYLKGYHVNTEKANTALETKEKAALIHATNDKFTMFVDAIKKKDILFFSSLEEEAALMYEEIEEEFGKNRIPQPKLRHYFSALFGEEITAKKLMDKLRAIDPIIFDVSNTVKSNGKKYFKLSNSDI